MFDYNLTLSEIRVFALIVLVMTDIMCFLTHFTQQTIREMSEFDNGSLEVTLTLVTEAKPNLCTVDRMRSKEILCRAEFNIYH